MCQIMVQPTIANIAFLSLATPIQRGSPLLLKKCGLANRGFFITSFKFLASIHMVANFFKLILAPKARQKKHSKQS